MQNQFTTEETPLSPLTPPALQLEERTTEAATDTHTAQAIQKRLEAMQRQSRRYKLGSRLMWGILIAFIPFPCIYVFLFGYRFLHDAMSIFVALIFVFASGITLALPFLIDHAPGKDAKELAKSGGVKAIGPLLEALDNPLNGSNRRPIYTALCLLLPQLKTSDALLLNRRQRDILHKELKSEYCYVDMGTGKAAFYIAALKALEQVGDERAIPAVTRLANMKSRKPNNRRVQQAAVECLAMLQANLGEVQSNQTLLRASELATSPEMLLRPAASAPSEQSEQLLRPH